MAGFLPPHLLGLFNARPPLGFLTPTTEAEHVKKNPLLTGVAAFMTSFDADGGVSMPIDTLEERRARKINDRRVRSSKKLEMLKNDWRPTEDPNAKGDPFKTLFIGRLNFCTTEDKLGREFESYGPVKRVRIVRHNNKSRGYAFVEFESEEDMRLAYKAADGRKIDDKRVVVDVERGRTVKTWLPRRLGGGLGRSRLGGKNECVTMSGRDDGKTREQRERQREEEREREREARRSERGSRDYDRVGRRYEDRDAGRDYDRGSGRGDRCDKRSRYDDRDHSSRRRDDDYDRRR